VAAWSEYNEFALLKQLHVPLEEAEDTVDDQGEMGNASILE
jgi:hypothetical protein